MRKNDGIFPLVRPWAVAARECRREKGMTAEIAIINRSAVTLATDSAVTLTVRGAEKIYNSADKLFELSERDPIGIMVYNNLEYMGISLEVAIKQFRCKAGNFTGVAEAADAFFEYLLHDLAPDELMQRQHATAILRPFFANLRKRFEARVTRAFDAKCNPRKVDFLSLLTQAIQGRIAELLHIDIAECFSGTDEHTLASFYSETLDALVAELFRD
jgi:hypothetical protein